jgi:ubiquinone biosynthesis protein COQ4
MLEGLRGYADVLRSWLSGDSLGDVALRKIALFSPRAHSPELDARLAELVTIAPRHDLARLRALPDGTLGREYARFLDDNGITPLDPTPELRAAYADNPFALRYTLTHDLHHVLTGFDAGLAGEIGVAAFTVGQGLAPWPISLAKWVYAALSPTQARRILRDARVGFELGERAALLVAEPLEDFFEVPLERVRARLGLDDPRAAGVEPSGPSVVERLIRAAT